MVGKTHCGKVWIEKLWSCSVVCSCGATFVEVVDEDSEKLLETAARTVVGVEDFSATFSVDTLGGVVGAAVVAAVVVTTVVGVVLWSLKMCSIVVKVSSWASIFAPVHWFPMDLTSFFSSVTAPLTMPLAVARSGI